MDFFGRQDQAHRKTRWLIAYFICAVIGIVVAVFACAEATLFANAARNKTSSMKPAVTLGVDSDDNASISLVSDGWDSKQVQYHMLVFIGVASVTLLVIFAGSAYKTAQLRGGGETVALMLGGRKILADSQDAQEKQLLNIVEEMAIAAGMAVPPVYVLRDQRSINAFAAGWDRDSAVVALNRGTLEYLNRDELQGVIAHEFSHILNGDMRMNIRLIGWLNGILVIGIIGYYLMRSGAGRSRSSNEKGNPLPLFGIGLCAIGFIGLFFGRLIKAAVSREREYLADASAVQFTRNPDGIGNALKKIGGLASGSIVEHPETESMAHMFFGSGTKRFNGGMFGTHPSLKKRILAIDPNFDGKFPKVRLPKSPTAVEAKEKTAAKLPESIMPGIGKSFPIIPAVILAASGNPSSNQLAYSQQVMSELSTELTEAAHEPFSARALVFALLIHDESESSQIQWDAIKQNEGEPTYNETQRLVQQTRSIPAHHHLPLLSILQGTLRELSSEQYDSFRKTVMSLIAADKNIDTAEFTILQMIIRKLDRAFGKTKVGNQRLSSLVALRDDLSVVLTSLARVGHSSEEQAEGAFRRACQTLDRNGTFDFQSADDCKILVLDKALQRLQQAVPAIKRRLVEAAIECVMADGEVTVEEAELLRVFADGIDVPIPPFLNP